MPFDLKNLNPAVRFYWGEDKVEWVELQALTGKQIAEFRKATSQKKVEYWRPQGSGEKPFRYEFTDTNDELFNEMFWDTQIVSWNLVDPEGKEIPCSKENKLLLLGNSNEFATWIMKCVTQLNEDNSKRIKDAEKN